jgi:hypothetical protein
MRSAAPEPAAESAHGGSGEAAREELEDRSIAFGRIARLAAGHEVAQVVPASPGDGHHVINPVGGASSTVGTRRTLEGGAQRRNLGIHPAPNPLRPSDARTYRLWVLLAVPSHRRSRDRAPAFRIPLLLLGRDDVGVRVPPGARLAVAAGLARGAGLPRAVRRKRRDGLYLAATSAALCVGAWATAHVGILEEIVGTVEMVDCRSDRRRSRVFFLPGRQSFLVGARLSYVY